MSDLIAREVAKEIKRSCDHSCESTVDDLAYLIAEEYKPLREALQGNANLLEMAIGYVELVLKCEPDWDEPDWFAWAKEAVRQAESIVKDMEGQ